MINLLEIIVKKLTSGKFWLTLMAGYAFVWAVVHKTLEPAASASIITAVFMAYFSRKNGDKNGNS